MDPRVHEHAETLVEWCARVESDDAVILAVAEGAHDLAVAVAEAVGERGADLHATYAADEVTQAYLSAHEGSFGAFPHASALFEEADVTLILGGSRNTAALADVPGPTRQAFDRANQHVREARFATDWVSTIHPTRALAQAAGMAYPAYRDFVYGAVLRDWPALAEEMARVKDRLDAGSTVQILTEDTDLSMSIEGRTAVNSTASVLDDSHNLPSGEVFTAPVVESVEGQVTFDIPRTVGGRRVRDVQLTFADGQVTDVVAAEGESAIQDVLDTDDGARRLGELGIGMNRGIDRFTDNVLFDEKMGGTVHLALGRAYDACLPHGETPNRSAVHVDLITRMGVGSQLLIDGEPVQVDGSFWYEDEVADGSE
ncbi:MAG: aminopeptidase [Halobacteriales archaeon]|nr:aminopeptidase [Halobacteriales archaeon]